MFQRKKKLINPRLQLRLAAIFLFAAVLAVQIQAILVALTLSQLAERMPNDGPLILSELGSFVRWNLLLTFALLAPVMIGVGILATFQVAGPLYRFEQFLRAVRDGRQTEPCRIRKGDELQDFCVLLNEVTAPLREGAATKRDVERVEDVDAIRPALPAERRDSVEKTTGAQASG